ncbi:MAG: HAD-IB family hydrolase [Planctomycetota bacterium]
MTSNHVSPIAAFFDIDGTLLRATVVHYYFYLRTRNLSAWRKKLWLASYLPKCLYYLWLDRRDRTAFNRAFYRDYRGLPTTFLQNGALSCVQNYMLPRTFPGARACVEQHLADKKRLVFVTGTLVDFARPLAESLGVHDVIAPSLEIADGLFTGVLLPGPLCGSEKSRQIKTYAARHQIDLNRSYAYADSFDDLAMLECVGFPQTVNPGKKLTAIAKKRNWPIHRWTLDASSQQ